MSEQDAAVSDNHQFSLYYLPPFLILSLPLFLVLLLSLPLPPLYPFLILSPSLFHSPLSLSLSFSLSSLPLPLFLLLSPSLPPTLLTYLLALFISSFPPFPPYSTTNMVVDNIPPSHHNYFNQHYLSLSLSFSFSLPLFHLPCLPTYSLCSFPPSLHSHLIPLQTWLLITYHLLTIIISTNTIINFYYLLKHLANNGSLLLVLVEIEWVAVS